MPADLYVNKSGNNGSNGLTPGTAKLTLQGAQVISTEGTIIHVGSGEYNEHVETGGNTTVWVADGYVVLDGQGSIASAFHPQASTPGALTFDGFIIKGFTGEAFLYDTPISSGSVVFRNCDLSGPGTPIVAVNISSSGNLPLKFENCTIHDCDYASFNKAGCVWGTEWWATNCTFYNIAKGLMDQTNSSGQRGQVTKHLGCIVHTCGQIGGALWTLVTGTEFPPAHATITLWDDSYYFNITGSFAKVPATNGGTQTTYTAMSDFVAAFALDTHSVSGVDPQLGLPAKGIFHLKSTSPALGAGVTALYRGAFNESMIHDSVNDAGAWSIVGSLASDGGTGWFVTGSLVINGSGAIQGIGTATSKVYNAGGIRRITKVRFTQTGSYPASIIDTENTDTAPNRRNVEWRHSTASFNQNTSEGTLPYAVYEPGTAINVLAQYRQYRLVFRADGVAA